MNKKLLLTALAFGLLLSPMAYFSAKAYQDKLQRDKILEFRHFAIKGYENMVHGDYKTSKEMYDKAYALHAKDTKTLLDMAQVYRVLNKHIRAKALYKEVLGINENSNSARFNYATYLSLQGDYKASNIELLILLHKDRRESKYFKLLALNSEKLGDTQTALGYYALLHQRDKLKYSQDKGLKNLAKVYAKMLVKPKPMNVRFKYEESEEVDVIMELALGYEKDGLDYKSMMAYRKVLLLDPKNEVALINIADLYMKHRSYEYALEFIAQVENNTYEILLKKGRFYQAAKKYTRALTFYEQALEHEQNAFLYHKLAVTSLHLKQVEKSQEYYDKLNALDPALAHQLLHAIQIHSGVKFSFVQSLQYEVVLAYYQSTQLFRA